MYDLEFDLANRPGALAALGEAMGRAGIPFDGGGVFQTGSRAIAHFLFRDGEAARRAAEAAGITVITMHRPLQPPRSRHAGHNGLGGGLIGGVFAARARATTEPSPSGLTRGHYTFPSSAK